MNYANLTIVVRDENAERGKNVNVNINRRHFMLEMNVDS